jgi:hypothetical protein
MAGRNPETPGRPHQDDPFGSGLAAIETDLRE